MKERDLRRRCQQIIEGLDLPDPFDIDDLCARLGSQRGRPILPMAIPMPPSGACGLWIATASYDAIFCQASTSRLHQTHILAHELGHLLCGHSGGPGLDIDISQALPDLDPGLVARVLGRAGYNDIQEREAEMVASLILRRAYPGRPAEGPTRTEIDVITARLARSLQGPGKPARSPCEPRAMK